MVIITLVIILKHYFKEFLLKFRCFFIGHVIVKDIWHNKENQRWYEEKDFEYHVGCTRCPLFYTERPE